MGLAAGGWRRLRSWAAALAGHCSRLGRAGAAVVVYEVGGVGVVHRGHPHAVLLPGDQSR